MSAATLFEAIARQPKDAVAIQALGRAPLSYSLLCDQIVATIRALNEVGLLRNDRLAVVLPNGPEMATACLAVASGASCVPLNPEYKQDEFDYFLSELGAKAVLVQAGMASPARDAARALGIPLLELRVLPEAPAGRFELALAEGGPLPGLERTPAQTGPGALEDIALVLHTSGTTARPKIVPLSQANLMASAANLCASLALTAGDRVLNMMPLFHIGGLVDLLLAPLSVGAASICTANFSLPGFVACLEAFDPTVYQGVPTMLQEILAAGAPEKEVIRSSSLRFVRSVSAPLPGAIRAEFESACGVPIVEIYGMTEASGLIASDPIPPGVGKEGSVGLAAGPDVTVLGESGEPVPVGSRGEVAIRGASVMAGYESPKEANTDLFVGSWMRTGDEGVLDEDGYLFLTGRIKEIINRGGEKISPREIDVLLAAHPAVAEAAAFALPHDALGEDVAVAVVLAPGAELSREEVIDYLRPRLAYFKVPRVVHFVSSIPTTAGGKLQRAELAERLATLGVPDAAAATESAPSAVPETLIAKTLASIWERILGTAPIGIHDDFFDLGGDSLKAATFINELQARWGEIVYVSALFDAPSIGEFEPYLNENCPALVVKILGQEVSQPEQGSPSRIDASQIERFREAIVPLAGAYVAPSEKNPTAVFILSTPRSGSTLLRAMLGGSEHLFAPPELFLLPFDDLAERKAWFSRSQGFLREGNVRAWMQLTGEGLEQAEHQLGEQEGKKLGTQAYYRMLQERLGERTLVDKTPFNAAQVETLQRAEQYFEDPLYIHLLRHPYGMIRSFEEAKLGELWHPRLFASSGSLPTATGGAKDSATALSPREFAEMIWVVLHQNILAFLGEIPAERQTKLRFEELVGSPRGAMEGLCGFLGVDFESAMLDPRANGRERMTDGIHPESRMIGDMKFHQHEAIDASAAELWKQHYRRDFLSDVAWELAAALGYDERLADVNEREEFVI